MLLHVLIQHFPHRHTAMHGKEEPAYIFLLQGIVNVLPQFFHPYHDIGFFRKFADLYHQVRGITYIDEENPIEKTDAERKRQIFRRRD